MPLLRRRKWNTTSSSSRGSPFLFPLSGALETFCQILKTRVNYKIKTLPRMDRLNQHSLNLFGNSKNVMKVNLYIKLPYSSFINGSQSKPKGFNVCSYATKRMSVQPFCYKIGSCGADTTQLFLENSNLVFLAFPWQQAFFLPTSPETIDGSLGWACLSMDDKLQK